MGSMVFYSEQCSRFRRLALHEARATTMTVAATTANTTRRTITAPSPTTTKAKIPEAGPNAPSATKTQNAISFSHDNLEPVPRKKASPATRDCFVTPLSPPHPQVLQPPYPYQGPHLLPRSGHHDRHSSTRARKRYTERPSATNLDKDTQGVSCRMTAPDCAGRMARNN